jgi:hypothetical protein
MTLPALLFAFLISSLYGVLYHIIRNGGPNRLMVYLVLAWVGFAGGHLLGAWRGWVFVPIGPLNFGLASLGSLLTLVSVDVAKSTDTSKLNPFSDDENAV